MIYFLLLILFFGSGVGRAQQRAVLATGQVVPKFSELPKSFRQQIPIGTPRYSRDIEASPFGIHTTIMAEGGDSELIENLARLCSEGGFKWVVDYVAIGNVKDMTPEQVGAKFASLPARCALYARKLQEARINLLVRLDVVQWEPWKGPSKFSADPTQADMQKALIFTRQVVRQLKPYTHSWIIWNEPNIGNEKPIMTPEDYVKMVAQVAQVIREEQPEAVIMGPATAMLQCMDDKPYPWINRALEAGLLKHINIFSFHPYRQPSWSSSIAENASEFHPWKIWGTYSAQIADLRERLKKYNGGKEVPLAATEDGMPNVINGKGEQEITWVVGAKYELRRALQDFYLGISPRTLFCLYRNVKDPFYDAQSSFSIVTANYEKKPTYYAAQNLNAVLDSSYQRVDSIPVKITVQGKKPLAGALYTQVYRKEYTGGEELMVFFWSAEIAGDRHERYPARMEVNEPGWQSPLQIDLMAMPAKRPKNEIVELIDSQFVNRTDPEQLAAVTTATGVAVESIEVRDYPLVIKWFRTKAH